MARPRLLARSGNAPRLIADVSPKSPPAEAYRTLRTNIQFAALDRAIRSLVFTSTIPDEGKTTTVANFGVVAAQGGSRVCIVDADLRRPLLHQTFGLPNERGLTTALVEGLSLAKVAHPTSIPNLSVATSGPLPAVHGELVGSRRMRELLEAAGADFDLIVCDTPPLMVVADAVALAAQCDGVVLVIRAGAVPADSVRRVVEQIEAVKGRILGVLLNNVDARRHGYYGDYRTYYNAYYGSRKKG